MTNRLSLQWDVRIAAALMLLGVPSALISCERQRHVVGSVNTEFKLIGPDHKIIIESYDDPKIDGITVFISKSQTGGIKGGLGLAEDTSDASVAVRQTGPIKVKAPFENGEDAFTERRSLLFKHLHVTRFWDAAHQSFVYVAWTDRLVNGSPHNSISAVVAQSWNAQAPDLSQMKLAQKMKTSHHSQVDHFFGAILISFRALQTNFPVPISRPRIASKLP